MHHVIDVLDVLIAVGVVLIPLVIVGCAIWFLSSIDFSK